MFNQKFIYLNIDAGEYGVYISAHKTHLSARMYDIDNSSIEIVKIPIHHMKDNVGYGFTNPSNPSSDIPVFGATFDKTFDK